MDFPKMKTTIQKISSNVWAIDQVMVRCFLIQGTKRAILLDTGAQDCNLPELIKTITDLPVLVIHTHGDGDHTANSHYFSDVYAHPNEFDVIRRFIPNPTFKLHPITKDTSFDLGERILKVIEAPGHTPGSICLLDKTNRILFSGDTLSYGPVFLFGDHRDIHTYRKTLDELMALGGSYDTIYPCHNTCPVSKSVVPALMAAVDGALDGSIIGTESEGPMPGGEAPLTYTVGKCGILYSPAT